MDTMSLVPLTMGKVPRQPFRGQTVRSPTRARYLPLMSQVKSAPMTVPPWSVLSPKTMNGWLNVVLPVHDPRGSCRFGALEQGAVTRHCLAVANRVIFMDQGRIVEENMPDEFFNNLRTDRSKDFLSKLLGH